MHLGPRAPDVRGVARHDPRLGGDGRAAAYCQPGAQLLVDHPPGRHLIRQPAVGGVSRPKEV
jgi:hypothetical protein